MDTNEKFYPTAKEARAAAVPFLKEYVLDRLANELSRVKNQVIEVEQQ